MISPVIFATRDAVIRYVKETLWRESPAAGYEGVSEEGEEMER